MDDGFTSECQAQKNLGGGDVLTLSHQAQFLLVHLDATTLDDELARW